MREEREGENVLVTERLLVAVSTREGLLEGVAEPLPVTEALPLGPVRVKLSDADGLRSPDSVSVRDQLGDGERLWLGEAVPVAVGLPGDALTVVRVSENEADPEREADGV